MRVLPAALAALGVLAACSPRGASTPRDVYTYLSIGDVESLDPAWIRDTASQSVVLQIYDTLVGFDGDALYRFQPRLAERVPTRENGLISADGRTYRFPIREGVRFQDGSVLTADDVRYSILRFCLLDREGGPAPYLLEPILGLRSTRVDGKLRPDLYARLARAVRVEGREVVITLRAPFAAFTGVFAAWAPVVSRAWAAAHGGWDGTAGTLAAHNDPAREDTPFFAAAMGTGAYKLTRWSRHTKEILLEAHPGHWRGAPAIARAAFRAVPEFSTRLVTFRAGDADSIYAERTEFTEVSAVEDATLVDDLPSASMNPVVFFTLDLEPRGNTYVGSGRLDGNGIPPDFFAERAVREAFAHAVDYDAFIAEVSMGKAVRAAGCIPPGFAGHAPGLPVRRFDLAKAKELLRASRDGAIWEKGFRLTVGYNSGNRPREILARMLKRNIESLSPKFKVDARPVLWPTYLAALNARKIPVFIIGWTGSYPDPDAYAAPFLHSTGFFPKMQGFADARFDALITRAKREPDPAARAELYRELQRLAGAAAIQVYVQHDLLYRAHSARLRGWTYQPMFPGAPHIGELFGLRFE